MWKVILLNGVTMEEKRIAKNGEKEITHSFYVKLKSII